MTLAASWNRWWVVVGALLIQLSLGAVYIWSVFQTPLQRAFPTWTEPQVTLPAQIVLAAFAVAVILGGRLQDKLGPRKVATAGGLLVGSGLILARFTGQFQSEVALGWLVATFSVMGGLGIGAGYVCPIATCVKWFPDKRGLVTGLAVAGFGAGAFFFAPLARGLISGTPYELLGVRLFPLPALGVFDTFLVLGVVFLVTVVLGAQLLRNPPPGYTPPGRIVSGIVGGAVAREHLSPSEMLRTPAFWLLWLSYLAGCTAGLQVIMKVSPIWQSFALSATRPFSEADFQRVASAGAMAVSMLAIFNSLGRIFWGRVSDSLGRKTTLFLAFTICGLAMLSLEHLRTYSLYLLGICTVGLCFGGFLALYPAVTSDYFGTQHLGANYGWMFTAYGVGGLLGPFLAAALMEPMGSVTYYVTDAQGESVERVLALGNYRRAFWFAGISCLLAGLICLTLRRPALRRI